ncbi:MAG: bis-aminopropyl spermidine synthase family protein [Candidatus Bathyarchaeia archaeon]
MKRIETHILRCLLESEKSIWELLDESPFLVKDFVDAINKMFSEGIIRLKNNKICLTEKGLERFHKRVIEFKSGKCRECERKGVAFGGRFEEILERFSRIVKDRPQPDVMFFQGYMHERDVISRVALMHYYNDLADKSFIIIGDDDLLSIALALTSLPSRILVLDIDARLGEYLERVCSKYGLNIEFQQYDVSNPLPKDLIGKFDVFSSEPLETLSGLKAFLSRGIACLGAGGVGYIGLTTAESSAIKWKAVELMLLRMNCVITDIIRDFSKYKTSYETADYEMFISRLSFPVSKNPGICWYKSSLFRFELMGKPKPIIDPEKKISVEYVDPVEDITSPLLYIKEDPSGFEKVNLK